MNHRRNRPILITLIVSTLIICAYLYLKHKNPNTDTETIMACLAIFTAVAFFLEYHQNNKLNEAQFVIDLNNQFLNEGNMAGVEHELEKYFNSGSKDKAAEELQQTFAPEKKKHQDLVNYLVHLEGIATLVNNGTLRLSAINDLMSYRFFLAMNNPVVQELELLRFRDYYREIIKLYPAWVKRMKRKGGAIPMEENDLMKRLNEKEIMCGAGNDT